MIWLVSGCDYVGEYKAEKFCAAVKIGTTINDLLESDKAKGLSNWQTKGEIPIKHKFGFGGFMFSNNICVIEVSNTKVINTYHEYYTLD